MARKLSQEEVGALWSITRTPDFELAAQIGRFDPPFEWARWSVHGFGPDMRFLLTRVIAGDDDAIAARDWLIEHQLGSVHGEFVDGGNPDPFVSFLMRREGEYKRFVAKNYPWFGSHGFEREPDIDAIIDRVVFEYLGPFGFGASNRSAKKTWWRCASKTLLSHPLVLDIDKGVQRVSLYAVLKIDEIHFVSDLAFPFFFSHADFPYTVGADVERQLRLFFTEYVKVFPYVIEGLRRVIPEADAYLRAL